MVFLCALHFVLMIMMVIIIVIEITERQSFVNFMVTFFFLIINSYWFFDSNFTNLQK